MPALVVDQAQGEGWCLYHGDSAEILRGLPDNSVDLAVYSPPFSHLYVYSASERDLGNSKDDGEFFAHYQFVSWELLRLLKPGRTICVHVMDLPTTLATHGKIEIRDFSGATIAHHVAQGWAYHGRITIDTNPQAQAIRTKSKSLLFVQKNKDRSHLRPALPQYLLLFRKPGDNEQVVKDEDVSNEDWIEWAHPVWLSVRETDTLNVQAARSKRDERHICPLSLDIIERCIRLWSNRGEVVLSPFAGLGSELYQAVLLGRKGIGVELNEPYFRAAVTNLKEAEARACAPTLASLWEQEEETEDAAR